MKYPREKLTQKAYIYGVIFSLANSLQCQGDSRDEVVTTKQWFAMANIAIMNESNLNIKELAHILGTSSQNTKKLVNLLEKKGYVLLQKDPSDQRNIRVTLTRNGKEYYTERAKREASYLDNLFNGLTEMELQQIYSSLQLLSANIMKKEEV